MRLPQCAWLSLCQIIDVSLAAAGSCGTLRTRASRKFLCPTVRARSAPGSGTLAVDTEAGGACVRLRPTPDDYCGWRNSWPSTQIHLASFGAQPVAADRNILDTLLDAGLKIPHDCERGECVMCTTRLLGGEPDHRDLCLNSQERASSMCVGVSRTTGRCIAT